MQFDSQALSLFIPHADMFIQFMRNKLTVGYENAHLEICFLFDFDHTSLIYGKCTFYALL